MIYKLFIFSVLLFGVGIFLSKIVIKKKISFLINIPLYLLKFATDFIEKHNSFIIIFLFIFLFNSFNASIYFFAGFVPYLPIFFNIWLGMNIGIVFLTPPEVKDKIFLKEDFEMEIEEDVGKGIIILVSSFIFIVMELFAVFYAMSLSHKINMMIIKGINLTKTEINGNLNLFVKYTIFVLLIAAFLETYIIKDSVTTPKDSK